MAFEAEFACMKSLLVNRRWRMFRTDRRAFLGAAGGVPSVSCTGEECTPVADSVDLASAAAAAMVQMFGVVFETEAEAVVIVAFGPPLRRWDVRG